MEEALIKRILPHSIEAEQSVIGSMILDRDAILVASEILTSDDFYQKQYGIIFDAMVELCNEGKPVDLVTLQNRLKEKELPPDISSMEYVRDLISAVPTSANVKYYAKIVSEKAVLRRLIKANEEIANTCYLEKENTEIILEEAEKKAEQDYQKVQEQNRAYRRLLKEERFEEAEELFESLRPLEQKQLANFKKEQDTFVRIDWYGNVLYPHEILLKNIRLLEDAIEDLEKAEVSKALGRLYQVDNNAYAFMFDEDVYNHFTDYVFHQPRERLKWGYGRIMEHEKLYTLVRSLLEKEKTAGSDFESEILRLKKVCEKQYTLLEKYTDKITEVLKETYLN